MSIADNLAKEVGPEPQATRPRSRRTHRNGASVFDLANEIDTLRVLDRLGIAHEDTARGTMAQCPGCSEDGALVCDEGGLKCMHARCANDGVPSKQGFRTNVDLVSLVHRREPKEAAEQICEWFGIPVPRAQGDDGYRHTDDDAPDAPPKKEKKGPPKLPFVWVRDFGPLMEPPKLRWLFRDMRSDRPFLRAGKCYAVSGDGGVGKGYFTLQTAVSIAASADLFGVFRPEQSGRVALLVGEDDQDEIHHRLYRIANALGLSAADQEIVRERVGVFPLSGEQVHLLTVDASRNPQRTEMLDGLVQQLTEMARADRFDWSLVGLDPLARFGAANVETDQTAATAFVSALEFLADKVPGNPAIGVSHHSSDASVQRGRSNMRGVTGLRDAFRLVMSLDGFGTPEGLRGVLVRNTKNNLAPEAAPLWLVRLDNEPMGGGRYLETAGVLRAATDEEIGALEAVAGATVGANREQRERAKTDTKKAKFEAECEAVFQCLPEEPDSINREDLLAALAAMGRGCSHHTLGTRIAALSRDGRVVDLSDGKKASARMYARAQGAPCL